jgi:hypothetical protein
MAFAVLVVYNTAGVLYAVAFDYMFLYLFFPVTTPLFVALLGTFFVCVFIIDEDELIGIAESWQELKKAIVPQIEDNRVFLRKTKDFYNVRLIRHSGVHGRNGRDRKGFARHHSDSETDIRRCPATGSRRNNQDHTREPGISLEDSRGSEKY